MAPDGYVVDTSVFVRWYLAQVGWEHARKIRDDFLAGQVTLRTVECARYEMPWVLRKMGLLHGHLTREEYLAACRTIDDLDIPVAPLDADGVERAAALSDDHNVAFFDAVFVLNSLESGLPLVTADKKLANAVGSIVRTVLLEGA